MLKVLLALALAAGAGPQLPIHDGGVCVGLSWVTLAIGEKVTVEQGPDFNVYRFEGPKGPEDHWWGVYSGNFAQVEGNGPLLFKRDGVTVKRAIDDGKFRGYLAEKNGWQNHFFGSVFAGNASDESFFDRVDFGQKGQSLCKEDR